MTCNKMKKSGRHGKDETSCYEKRRYRKKGSQNIKHKITQKQ
jgi:hypothetical protein